MQNKNSILNQTEELNEESVESFDLDELEEKLQSQLEEEFSNLEFLKEEKGKIENPDALGNVIMDVVWQQFLNQVAITAGNDFIEENKNLHLDLRKEAHFQTTENFKNGKIATHNTKIDYKQRYDNYQENFQKDPDIEYKNSNYKYNEVQNVWEKYDNRSGNWKKVLKKDARSDFDKGRPRGKSVNNTNMDHTISAAEIMRDSAANAHMTRKEQIEFANSKKNLNLMDSAANQSKGDSTISEFLDSKRNGKKAAERFNISEGELRKKDAEARKEYEKLKKEGEEKSIAAGKQSQREEAFRIGGKVLRVVAMQLLAELIREIIVKLINWFKNVNKTLNNLLDSLKDAIQSFIGKMKTHLINLSDTVFSTVANAIVGPIFGVFKKLWIMLKQSWASVKNAVKYIKNPANRHKSVSIMLMEVGKIIIAGLTGVGALALGELIEDGLKIVPVFVFEIPLLGSLANILGIFFGAVVAGISGAIAINFLDKLISKKKKREIQSAEIENRNQILDRQHQVQIVSEASFERCKEDVHAKISKRRREAVSIIKDTYGNIMEDFVHDFFENANKVVIDEEDIIFNKKVHKARNDLDDLLK